MVLPRARISKFGVIYSAARLGQVGGIQYGASGQPQLPIVRFSRSDRGARVKSVLVVLLQNCYVVGYLALSAEGRRACDPAAERAGVTHDAYGRARSRDRRTGRSHILALTGRKGPDVEPCRGLSPRSN